MLTTRRQKKKLQKAIDDWAAITKQNTQIEFVDCLFNGTATSTHVVDRFSSWLLAGTGATAALMIANLNDLLLNLTSETLKVGIHILIISALFGFLSKYKSVHCQISASINEKIYEVAFHLLDKHEQKASEINSMAQEHKMSANTEMDMSFVIDEFCKAYPFYLKPIIYGQFSKGFNDRLYCSRKLANQVFWQSNYATLQFLSFLVFLYFTVNGINGI